MAGSATGSAGVGGAAGGRGAGCPCRNAGRHVRSTRVLFFALLLSFVWALHKFKDHRIHCPPQIFTHLKSAGARGAANFRCQIGMGWCENCGNLQFRVVFFQPLGNIRVQLLQCMCTPPRPRTTVLLPVHGGVEQRHLSTGACGPTMSMFSHKIKKNATKFITFPLL